MYKYVYLYRDRYDNKKMHEIYGNIYVLLFQNLVFQKVHHLWKHRLRLDWTGHWIQRVCTSARALRMINKSPKFRAQGADLDGIGVGTIGAT